MRARILFVASVCLLFTVCTSRAAHDIIPIRPSEVAPDRSVRIVPIPPTEVAPDHPARVVPVPPSEVAPERPCDVAAHRCAISAAEWTIFADSNPGVPDFWRTPDVEVREIIRCGHGIQFLFPAVQDGQPRLAALVFPVPTAELLATRVGIARGSSRMESELAHYQGRFVGDASGAAVRWYTGVGSHRCNVYWNNAGGPMTGAALDASEIVADPLFCDAEGGNFHVGSGSPCLPGSYGGCGLIGRFGEGCGQRVLSLESLSWGAVKAGYRGN